MDVALIPVKPLRLAKARLADHFDRIERFEIAEALVEDAFALARSAAFLSWLVVTEDPVVVTMARAAGLDVAPDPGEGLNAALASAIATATSAGAGSVTILPCDLPLAWSGDLQDLLDTGATSDVVVVPSGDDGGTNALYLSPPDVLTPRFGPGSLKAHIEEAERLKVRCSVLALDRLALDIDTIEDVDAFLARPNRFPSKTGQVLDRLRGS